ncbi:hypothetical protein CYMTET_20140 [Cymbomonas tetramitiformis]|uniref:Uncharacterized protein n=1 Tax=Cymbomonas tetramitiformis TaxID=36881 RepID=A0AAE0KUR5_9CHLO|nr:hypothetical protein CYMTET_29852 [Cymbomonas tetramitiformis]KAK3271518.1 hypothetical protein CYMTET_20140 [Cymbomonas tetramitiformis]
MVKAVKRCPRSSLLPLLRLKWTPLSWHSLETVDENEHWIFCDETRNLYTVEEGPEDDGCKGNEVFRNLDELDPPRAPHQEPAPQEVSSSPEILSDFNRTDSESSQSTQPENGDCAGPSAHLVRSSVLAQPQDALPTRCDDSQAAPVGSQPSSSLSESDQVSSSLSYEELADLINLANGLPEPKPCAGKTNAASLEKQPATNSSDDEDAARALRKKAARLKSKARLKELEEQLMIERFRASKAQDELLSLQAELSRDSQDPQRKDGAQNGCTENAPLPRDDSASASPAAEAEAEAPAYLPGLQSSEQLIATRNKEDLHFSTSIKHRNNGRVPPVKRALTQTSDSLPNRRSQVPGSGSKRTLQPRKLSTGLKPIRSRRPLPGACAANSHHWGQT